MTGLVILIPAAGASLRMRGRDKLLEEVEGVPLLRRQACLALSLDVPVLVTLPQDKPARAAAIKGFERLSLSHLPDASEGMSVSLRAGAGWAEALGARGMMVLLADLPELEQSDLRQMADAFRATPDQVVRATSATGEPGHPVIFPARLFPKLAELKGDTGARDILTSEAIRYVPLPEAHATTDLDTPEAWSAWREKAAKKDNPG